MRLIDVDSLLETTNWLVFADNKVDVAYVQVADIMRQPTIEAVPLVRCRDCIRWRQSKTNTAAKVCDWDRYEKAENDYCSWAKRREDG